MYHLYVLKALKSVGDEIRVHEKFYETLDFDKFPQDLEATEYTKTELMKRSETYHKLKREYTTLLNDLQTQKLFEGFAESAPEAVLQISIILTKGTCSKAVLMSVITSFVSLSKCAVSTYVSMPTKGKTVKEASWKTNLFFALPFMIMIATLRIISLSILTSYMKEWVFLAIFFMVSINCLVNCRFVWRDPAKASLGCLTNIFAPTIVVEDSSAFFLKSSLMANLLHALSLVILMTSIVTGGFQPMPQNKTQPSIFHCFNNEAINNSHTIMRCQLKGDLFCCY